VFGAALATAIALAGCGSYAPGTLPQARAITLDAAWDGDAAISPDGKTVAFVSERVDGRRGLFTRPTQDNGEIRTLVTGPGDVSRPSWSRDGRRVLFTRADPASGTTHAFVVDVAGGEPKPLGVRGQSVADAVYSPDGNSVACVVRGDSTWTLVEMRIADRTTRPLLDAGPGDPPSRPTWARRGEGLAFAWRGDLWWVAHAGGAPTRLTFTAGRERDPAFSPDGRWLAFTSDSTGNDNLWLARLHPGDRKHPPALETWRPASASFQPTRHAAWAPGGHTLWFERQEPWVVAAMDAGGGAADTLSSSLFDSREPSFAGDDMRVVFSSPRIGASRVWIMASSGEARSGPAKQLTQGPGEDVEPDASKASGQVVYVNRAPELGVATLALTDQSGAPLGPLTGLELAGIDQATRDSDPAWSRDGRSVAFVSNRASVSAIWVIEGVGRRLRLVTVAEGQPRTPGWSPDGAYLFYAAPGPSGVMLWRVPAAGGVSSPWTADDTPGFADSQPAVSPDGTRMVFTRQRHGDRDLWMLDAGGQARPVLTNARGQDAHANWSSDGRRLVFETGGAVNLYRADVRPLLLR
jgi:Tol biopolymer transport system component